MLSSGIVLLHGIARPHTAAAKKRLLQRVKCILSPYNSDVAPCDFELFPRMKGCLAGQHYGTDIELQTSVENWLKAQVGGFYEEVIGKLVPRYEKCLRRSPTM